MVKDPSGRLLWKNRKRKMYLFLFTDCFIVSQYLSAALPFPIWSGHCRIFSTEHSAYQTLLPCLSSRELSNHLLASRFSSPLSQRVSSLPSHSKISLNAADRSAWHFNVQKQACGCIAENQQYRTNIKRFGKGSDVANRSFQHFPRYYQLPKLLLLLFWRFTLSFQQPFWHHVENCWFYCILFVF